jgi:hypothetical protein
VAAFHNSGGADVALDVYGLTRHRDADTLNRFIREYVDLAANAERGDEELMLEPLDTESGTVEWEPSLTLSHIVERGLAYPRRAFTAYFNCLPSMCQEGIERAILGFTRDDQLVLGLSVYTGEWEADEVRAKDFLSHLSESYQCHVGLILSETPPPMSEAGFRRLAAMLPADFVRIVPISS